MICLLFLMLSSCISQPDPPTVVIRRGGNPNTVMKKVMQPCKMYSEATYLSAPLFVLQPGENVVVQDSENSYMYKVFFQYEFESGYSEKRCFEKRRF